MNLDIGIVILLISTPLILVFFWCMFRISDQLSCIIRQLIEVNETLSSIKYNTEPKKTINNDYDY
jgi:hypothetical protein